MVRKFIITTVSDLILRDVLSIDSKGHNDARSAFADAIRFGHKYITVTFTNGETAVLATSHVVLVAEDVSTLRLHDEFLTALEVRDDND